MHNTLSHYSPYKFSDTDRPDSALSFVQGGESIAAHRSVPDFLNDFDARIRLNPFASTPEGPPEPHSVSFPHLSVGKLSLGHLQLARKATIPNGLPVDLDVSL